ncbi:MAG TPA: hypothetical protein VJV96_05475 [Candidatus Angelobacter sp.]|jgi:hypothetical protein|nr:hypothetical protein [Candidatus Angelobacter sp.]
MKRDKAQSFYGSCDTPVEQVPQLREDLIEAVKDFMLRSFRDNTFQWGHMKVKNCGTGLKGILWLIQGEEK